MLALLIRKRYNIAQFFAFFGHPLFYIPVIGGVFFINQWIALNVAISVVIAEVIGGAIKLLLYTKRPQERPRLTLYQKWDASSFPSMHTSRIIVLALWMIAGFFSFLMTVAAIILVGVVAYSRIALKAHYIRDVVGGIILGIVSWLFVLFFFP